MGTKNKPGKFDCLDKIAPDEPYFVLRANDPNAADVVRFWSMKFLTSDRNTHHVEGVGQIITYTKEEWEKFNEAMRCADAMEEWRKNNK